MARDWIESSLIAGHFKVVGTHLPILHSTIGRIDFRKITLEQAQQLYSAGSPYLMKIASKKQVKK